MPTKAEVVERKRAKFNNYSPFLLTCPNVEERRRLFDQDFLSDAAKTLTEINIITIGEAGTGKSSCISSMHRTLHKKYDGDPIAPVRLDVNVRGTTKTKRYAVDQREAIKMCDTKGLEKLLRADEEVLKAWLTKHIKDDTEVTQVKNPTFWAKLLHGFNTAAIFDPKIFANKEATVQDVPHAVIVVIDAEQVSIPPQMINFIRILKEKKHQPLFIITKIDKGVDPSDGLGWAQNFNLKRDQLVELLARAFPDDVDMREKDIVMCPNYTQWGQPVAPSVSIEWQALDILERSITKAEQWLLQNHYTYKSIFVRLGEKMFGW